MNLTSELDNKVYRRYVQSLPIGSSTRRSYYAALRRFQRFMATQTPEDPLSQETIIAWLEHLTCELSVQSMIDYVRKIDGFLDWLVDQGQLHFNPWVELRDRYGGRLAPIVRALLAPKPAEALNALQPRPDFGSHLGPAMSQYLTYKQTLGFRYEREKKRLLAFDRYVQTRPDAEQQPLHVLVQEYAELALTPEAKFERLQSGRNLARGFKRYDPSTIVPKLDTLIVRDVVGQRRQPHIFSADEIRKLFAAAEDTPSPRAPLRPQTLHTALALAYGAGLRLGELARLTVGNLDLKAHTLDIRETKFFKSRRLPLTVSVMAILKRYLDARKYAGASEEHSTALLWNEKSGRGYKEVTLEHLLTDVIRRADLKPATGRIGPRLHDVRHTFVCHRMLAWYQAGVDVQSRLPYLATYLGHKDINSTLVYLTVTQELLQQANTRFHDLGAQVLKTNTGENSCRP